MRSRWATRVVRRCTCAPDTRRPGCAGRAHRAQPRRSLRRRSHRPTAGLRSVAGTGIRGAGAGAARERRDGSRAGGADRLLRGGRCVGRRRVAAGLVGGSVFLPVRGYERSTRSGRYAWSTSVELRAPLALVNRGLEALPLHLDRIFGSVFLDGGNAWGGRVVCRRGESQAPGPAVGRVRGQHRPARPVLGSVATARRCRLPPGRAGGGAILRSSGSAVLTPVALT